MNIDSMRLSELLNQTAAKSPVPGGGAITGAVGALAAALGSMVVAYSLGRKALAEHQDELERAATALRHGREVLLELAREDAHAYALVNELTKLPESDARRTRELPAAAEAATRIPLALIATCADLLSLMDRLAAITNRHLRSDLAIAAILAEATARASRWNIAVNMPLWTQLAIPGDPLQDADDILSRAAVLLTSIEFACR